jgi:hypothetical protein
MVASSQKWWVVGVFKDVFDWYPTSSSAEERK